RSEWFEYHRRAPSPEALQGIAILDNTAEAARLAAQLFEDAPAADRAALLERGEPRSRFANPDPEAYTAPAATSKRASAPTDEGIGSLSLDPNANLGNWALKRSDVLPEGVEPPADPLKPDVLPRDMSGEMPQYDAEGRPAPI